MSDPIEVPKADGGAKATAIRAARARKERNKRIALIGGLVLVLGAVIAAGSWYGSDSGTKVDDSSVEVAAGDGSIVIGSSAAPVKIVIYEDFLCPTCRELEDSTRDFLSENAAKGKVRVEYHPVDLLTQTTYSARALNVWAAVLKNSSPTDALKLHDLLYENQPDEAYADKTTDADLAALVHQVGADNAVVQQAMQTRDAAFIAAAKKVMTDNGVTSTPTVFIDGKKQTGTTVLELVTAIENAVGGS